MASTKAKRHVHKYYRLKLSYQTVWACALPECSHHMPAHQEALVTNKATICWKCGETTIMDSRTMAMEKPLCDDCDPNAIPVVNEPDVLEFLNKQGIKI